jgi:autotransporter-associated beta strand protein
MISEGVLRFVNGALGSGPIMFDGGTLQWATGNTQDVSARIDLPDSYTGAIIDTNGNNVIFSTAITDVPVSVGFVDLTKTGDGTLTLAAANTYTGDTVISGGNLYVTGSVAGKVIIGGTVLSSATLSGTGTVGDVTVGAYGILSPGSLSGGGIGTLTTGNLAFTGGANSFYRADIANGTPACDTINVHGTVTLGGATLDIYGSRNRLINEALKLILNDGTDETSGTFAGLTEGSTLSVGGVDYDVSYLFNGDAGGTANDLALLTL